MKKGNMVYHMVPLCIRITRRPHKSKQLQLT